MSANTFAILVAIILVVTRLLLGHIEEKDRSLGREVNHSEYTFGGILKMLFKDAGVSIRDDFRKMVNLFKRGEKNVRN